MAKSRGSSNLLDHYVDDSFMVESSALTLHNSDLIFQETATIAGWELQHKKSSKNSLTSIFVIIHPHASIKLQLPKNSDSVIMMQMGIKLMSDGGRCERKSTGLNGSERNLIPSFP